MKLHACLALAALVGTAQAQEPDYTPWTRLLQAHYDPIQGMDYEGLASKDWAAMKRIVQLLAEVDPARLNRDQQLAYYLNLYNVTVVNLLMENRQVKSIRDLSTDPLIRFNIFRKDLVLNKSGKISLKRLEDEIIREGFKDPRIHFAINCAARSCPPIRQEAFTGSKVNSQLDDQARAFFAHPHLGARLEVKGGTLVIHLTKIMDTGSWFGEDFEKWGGGRAVFLRKYLTAPQHRLLDIYSGHTELAFDAYDWNLNRWTR